MKERFTRVKVEDPTRTKWSSERCFKVTAINGWHSELCENEAETSN